jgi:hypothetical protein
LGKIAKKRKNPFFTDKKRLTSAYNTISRQFFSAIDVDLAPRFAPLLMKNKYTRP